MHQKSEPNSQKEGWSQPEPIKQAPKAEPEPEAAPQEAPAEKKHHKKSLTQQEEMTKYEKAVAAGKDPVQDTFSIDGEPIAVDALEGEEDPETLLQMDSEQSY